MNFLYPTEMRAVPTILTFNPLDAAPDAGDDWVNDQDDANLAAATANTGSSSTTLVTTETVVNSEIYLIHATADAEL